MLQGFNVTYTFILHNNESLGGHRRDRDRPVPVEPDFVVGPEHGQPGALPTRPQDVWSSRRPWFRSATATLTVTARIDVLGPITNTASMPPPTSSTDLTCPTTPAAVSITGQMPPDQISKRFFLFYPAAAALDPAAACVAVAADPPASDLDRGRGPTPPDNVGPGCGVVATASVRSPGGGPGGSPAGVLGQPCLDHPAARWRAAPATNSQGSRTNLLSGGGGEDPVTPADAPAGGPSLTVRQDLSPGIPSGGEATTDSDPGDRADLDRCLADWGRVAATEAVPPASWFRDDLPFGLDAAARRPVTAEERPNGAARGELTLLAVAALLLPAAPRLNGARNRVRREGGWR